MTKYTLRPIEAADQLIVSQLLTESWGSPGVVLGHGRVADASTLPGLIASQDGRTVGLLTFSLDGRTAELVRQRLQTWHRHDRGGELLL